MNKQIQINHFDSIAHRYDYYKAKNSLYYKILKKAIKEQITTSKPTILDVGCATGNILSFLNPNLGVGIDCSSIMIKIAKNRFKHKKSLFFMVHDIEKKSLSGKFDYILLNDVIEHLLDAESALRNISSIMTKKTHLILSMANPIWEPLMLLMEFLHLKMPEGPHIRISEYQLTNLLKKTNLTIYKRNIYFPHINLPLVDKFGLIYVYTIKKSF